MDFLQMIQLYGAHRTLKNLEKRLQASVNEFYKWCEAWKLEIQRTKTEILYFSPHRRKRYRHKLEMKANGVKITPQPSARYLGVYFDNKLNWKVHIQRIAAKVVSRIYLLRLLSTLSRNTKANENTMPNLYKSLVKSVITYGSSILCTAEDSIWQRLQIVQNKALRAALGVPRHTSTECIHKKANVVKIKTYAATKLQQSIQRAVPYEDEITEENILNIKAQTQQI